MGSRASTEHGTDSWQRQRVVKRSRPFVIFPAVIVLGLTLNLAWSIAGANYSKLNLQSGLFDLTLTSVDTAANLLGLAVTKPSR
jgi:hypothetical protein